MRRSLSLFLRFFMVALLASSAFAQQPKRSGEAEQASSSYVIKPLDYVVFRIIGEPDTDVQLRVASDGTISLPYIKEVKVEGLSVSDAQQLVYELYDGDYYIDPQIDLAVLASSEKMVQIIGYVIRPGNIPIPAEKPLYLMEAISAVGGAVPLGDLKRVEIRRNGPDGQQEKITVNTQNITSRDYELQDGDIIEIPRRIL